MKEKLLKEITVKIGLKRMDMQERIMVEALLDSRATELVMRSKFARKQGFKLKKLKRPMNVRNVDRSLNKKGPIENTVEVNIYYKGHRERIEINVIGGQKWTVILEMLWLACHNPEIDWKTDEVKMMRCLEECEKQWRPEQMEKTEGGRSKRRSRKKIGGKGKKEEAEERKDSGSKENSRGVGNLG